MLSLANIYTLYFRLYFRLCICLNKLSINKIISLKYIYYKNKVKYNKKIVTNYNKIIIKKNNYSN